MKLLLPCLLACLLACLSCSSSNDTLKPTILKGKIMGHNKRVKRIGLITNAVRTGLEVPNYFADIDSAGNYVFELPLKEAIEARISYVNRKGYDKILYLKPEEELLYNFVYRYTYPKNKEQSSSFKDAKKMEGTTVPMIEKMNAFDKLFRDSFQVDLDATQFYALVHEFRTHRAKLTPRIRKLQKDFIEKHAKDDPLLANWVKNHAEYRLAMDYMAYAFKKKARSGMRIGMHSVGMDLKEGFPKGYVDFTDEFPLNNDAAHLSLNYQNYIHLYRKYLISSLHQMPNYQDCKKLPTCNVFEMELTEIMEHFEGYTKDISLSQHIDFHLIRNSKDFLQQGYPQFLAQISDSLLLAEIKARKDHYYKERPFTFPKNAKLFQSDATGIEILKMIKERHAERPTMLFFWDPQIDINFRALYYPEQQHEAWKVLDSVDCDLVILAYNTTPNVWKDQITRLSLINDLWYLNEAQLAFFKDFFLENRNIKSFFHDKNTQYENFLLLLDETGQLQTSQLPFSDINNLARWYKRNIDYRKDNLIN